MNYARPHQYSARQIDSAEWIIAAMGLAYLFSYAGFYISGSTFTPGAGNMAGGDFKVIWAAARLAAEGRVSELYDIPALGTFQAGVLGEHWRTERFTPFPYPPHAMLMFLPLAMLPYAAALATWLATSCAAFMLAAGTGRTLRDKALLLGAPALTICLAAGQTGLLAAALFIGGMRLVSSRPYLAGILFGLLTFKPHLGLLLPVVVIAGGYWRTLFSAAGTAAILFCASLALAGPGLWLDYLQFSNQMWSGYLAELTRSESAGFGGMYASVFGALYSLGVGLPGAALGQVIATSGAIAAVAGSWRTPAAAPWRLPLVAALAFIANPYTFIYDMPLLAFAVMAAGTAMFRSGFRPGEMLILAAAWLLPVLSPAITRIGVPIAPLVIAAFAYMLWRRLSKAPAQGTQPLESDVEVPFSS